MEILAIILCAILLAISFLHYYWAFGGFWPAVDEATLARTVIGVNGLSKMPPAWLTATVATCILLAALFPLLWSAQIPQVIPARVAWLGMWVLTAIFIGRGIAGYLPFFRNAHGEKPFAGLDKKYFSPLCLIIGAGFASLLIAAGD
jgi:hypothetical protein